MNSALSAIRFHALAIALSGAAAAGIAFQSQAAPAPAVAVVHIANFTFSNRVIAVHPGTTVTWINDDDIPHTVVSKGPMFRSKVLDTGDRFTVTFAKAGEFDYFCSIHPHMTGKVIVKA